MRAFFVTACSITVVFGMSGAVAASAQELPAGILRMADGKYYQPSTGIMTADGSVFGIVAVTSSPALATTTTLPIVPPDLPATSTLPTSVTSTQPMPSALSLAITRAQDELQKTIDADGAGKLRTEKVEPVWRHVTLAIWNPKTDAVRYVKADKNGKELRGDDPALDAIDVTVANGINSTYVVHGAAGELVVAVRYQISTDRSITKKKKVYDTREVVYTPYSPALATPEIIAAGKKWLDDRIAAVYATLRTSQVKSRALPDKLVSDVLDPSLVKSIIFIEHMDVSTLKMNTAQLNPLYVTLATNTEKAFAYSRSPVGAMGLVQFMPKTYAAVAKWKGYGLNANFEDGMGNATNAITAEVAYLDYLMACLPEDVVAQYATDPTLVHEVVAAAYNGGATRAVKAMAAWDANTDPKQRLSVKTRSRLKLETMNYVLKLRQVMQTLFPPTQVS